MLYEALQIRLLEVFLWSVRLHSFVGQLWYVTPGSRGDRYVLMYTICICFGLYLYDLVFYKQTYLCENISYGYFRFYSVTESFYGFEHLCIYYYLVVIYLYESRCFMVLKCDILFKWWRKFLIYSDFYMLIRIGEKGVTLVVSEQVGQSGQVVESVWCDSWILSMLFVP